MPADLDRFRRSYSVLESPDADWTLSPYTGLTRAHWTSSADDLLLAAARYCSPGGARYDFPGRPSRSGMRSDGFEGFARTFLLAAFRHVAGDDTHDHLARYAEGLVAGTRHPGVDDAESWPLIGSVRAGGQPMVESASVALGLQLTPEAIWSALDAGQQDRVDAWLRPCLRHEPAPNNWYLFPLTVAGFLESVGRGDEETARAIDRGLGLLEGWYRGDGWYTDGDGRSFDHYVGWALHLYPMLYARLAGKTELLATLGERLRTFLGSFAHTFDRNGAPLHYGRSLTYRTATLAAVALGAVTGHTPLTPGASRRILSANLRYFAERGWRTDGILSLGWHGPHRATLQRYSGPASPYWASKGFLALLAPAGDPLWTSVEAPLDADSADIAEAIPPAGFLVQVTSSDGLVRIHNHGSDGVHSDEPDAGLPDPLYARLGYSTRTGPTSGGNPSDNDIQVCVGGLWSARRRIHPLGAGDGCAASWHIPRFPASAGTEEARTSSVGRALPSARIESATAVRGRLEVRIHRLVNVPEGCPVRLAGWAVAAARPEDVAVEATEDSARVRATGEDGVLVSQLAGVHGWQEAMVPVAPEGTAFGPWARVPELRATASEEVLVAIASLTAEDAPADPRSLVAVSVAGASVTIRWPDGPDTTIDLDALGGP